jgi:hypothetical protein
MWDDAAIAMLNPTLAAEGKLPAMMIQIAYTDLALGFADVLKEALSLFSPEFASALQAANNQLAGLPPTTTLGNGHSFPVPAQRLAYMQVSLDGYILIWHIRSTRSPQQHHHRALKDPSRITR